jgi:hypothetical protein
MQAHPVAVSQKNTRILFRIVVAFLSIALCGCSRNFYTINPAQIRYDEGENAGDSVFVAYRMDMQFIFENDPYGNREVRKKIMSVGTKITNRSSHSVWLTPGNFGIYGRDDEEKTIYSPTEYGKKVRQPATLYLFEPFATSFLNYLVAVRANKWNVKCQREHKIWNREILPNHSIYGLVSINAKDGEPLGFYYNPKSKPIISSMKLSTNDPAKIPRTSRCHTYHIRLQNGADIETFSKIEETGGEQFVFAQQGFKIWPRQTKWIYRIDGGTAIIGRPFEGCWVFEVMHGSVQAFNYSSDDKSIVFLKKVGGGPMVPFSPEALKFMTDDVAKVEELILSRKYREAIKTYNEQF